MEFINLRSDPDPFILYIIIDPRIQTQIHVKILSETQILGPELRELTFLGFRSDGQGIHNLDQEINLGM